MIHVNLFQLTIFTIFTLFIYKYFKKATAIFDYCLIVLFYIGFNIVLIYPYILADLSRLFGIGRGVDLFLYLSVFGLFLINIHLALNIRKNHEDISKLNRKISILLSKINGK